MKTMPHHHRLRFCAFALALFLLVTLMAVPRGRAQVVNDGATNTLNNVTNTIVGDVTVGTNAPFTFLLLTNGAFLTNSGHGYIGSFAAARSNTVWLTGTNTRWHLAGSLTVGSNGSWNRLVISNGATVANNIGTLGAGAASSNNLAMVTGVGSRWSNAGGLIVGQAGSGNQLIVSNGGLARNGTGTIGSSPTSSGNVAMVTGTGSLWSNAGLLVGYFGSGNQLVVSNGGVVANSIGHLGVDSTSSNNAAVVTGTNSLWTNASDLFVGESGSGNRLVVSNGGVVANALGYLGFNSTSINNVAVVTGTGSLWSNASDLRVGNFGSGNQLVVSNGGVVRNDVGHFGFDASSSNNLAVVTGTNSLWSNANSLYVGYVGPGNQLVVSSGGVVASTIGELGLDSNSGSNVALVTGAGSLWDNTGSFFVGGSGSGNRLVVSNGGGVRNFAGQIGAFGSNNVAVVTGTNSLWTNASDLRVGSSGSGNQLVVSNGGVVRNDAGYLGFFSNSSLNAVVVTGAGSVWSNASDLRVGNAGSGNQLVVSSGGVVQNSTGRLGDNSSSSNNVAVVTGLGSVWSNINNLSVGSSGSGNQLVVSNGGLVQSLGGTLGAGVSSSNNVAVVTGAGSLWTNSSVTVGFSGSGNLLVVSNGGTVVSLLTSYLGFNSTAANNRIITDGGTLRVTNAGVSGVFDIRRGTNVLNAGTNDVDQLVMTNALGVFDFNGGTLITRVATISNGQNFVVGANAGFSNATWEVRSNATSTTVAGDLYLGFNAPNARLLLTNGGTLANLSGYLGYNSTASNNVAVVTGSGSRWTNSGGLVVGSSGSGNQLLVSNGGTVSAAANVFVGFDPVSAGNRVVVDGGTLRAINGPGTATLDIRRGTNVLNAGLIEADRLLLTNGAQSVFTFNGGTLVTRGGTVANGLTLVVGLGGATAATLDVRSGVPLTAANSFMLGANAVPAGNRLLITNGGTLSVTGQGNVGSSSAASNNVATVAGSNSLWTISTDLNVGVNGSGNQLMISNGGTVGNGFGFIGNNTTSSRNLVTVSGAGALWVNNFDLYVGNSGGANQLVIGNGATVRNATGYVGNNVSSPSNLVVVTGAGSLWSNSSHLFFGNGGSGNQLMVSNGGTVRNNNGYLGVSATSSNNLATVTGPGSLWTNFGDLYVGNFSGGNQLTVSDGGTVQAPNAYLGFNVNASNNRVTVDGGTLRVTNAGGTAVYEIRCGTNVLNAGLIVADRLLLTNSAGFFTFNGGTLNVRTATVSNGVPFTVGNGTSNAMLTFTGTGTRTFADGLRVAGNAAVTLTNGLVDAGFLTMTNAGSVFTFNGGTLITRGGTISNGLDFIVGLNAGFPDATWDVRSNTAPTTVADFLYVGNTASNARLLITNGATLNGSLAFIGANPGGNSNAAIVSGPNSAWLNTGELDVGANGAFNTLLVTNGGRVANGTGYIGGFSNFNAASVTGYNSTWSNSGSLSVGVNGSFNTLLVTNGGAVFASGTGLIVGAGNSSSNNRVTVDGGTLRVTNASSTAALEVRRGTNVLNAGLIEADRLVVNNTLGFLESNKAGFFQFNGGTLNVGSVTVSNGALFIVGNGTSNAIYRMSGVATNGHSFANGLLISSNATLTGNGTITGSVTNFGTISAGSSAGSIRINGDLSLKSSSMMSFEIGGLIATNEYDQVTVSNLVQFAGTLSLSLLNNFLPAPANTFTLVSFGFASGSFANISAGRVSLTNNLASFAVTQTATNLILGAVTYVDSDGDGQGDLQEQAAGTDPASQASAMKITALARIGGGPVTVTFQSVVGKNYRIEYSNDLITWSVATTAVPANGIGNSTDWIDDGSLTGGLNAGTTRRFYRLGLQ